MNKIFLLLLVSLAISFIYGCDNNTISDKDVLIEIVNARYWHINIKNTCKQDSPGELILSIEKGGEILLRKKIIDLSNIHRKDKFTLILQYIAPKSWRIYLFSESTGRVSYDIPKKLLKDCIISSCNLSKELSLDEYFVKYGLKEISQNFFKCNNDEYGIRLIFKEHTIPFKENIKQ